MRATIAFLTFILIFSAFADEEKDAREYERDMERRRNEISRLQSRSVDENILSCSAYTERVKKIQGMMSKAKAENKDDSRTLAKLEEEQAALRAEQVLIQGLKTINNKYKQFLGKISGLQGWEIDGFDEAKNFSLDQLEKDVKEMDEHLQNAKTMHIMDALLKEAINDPDRLVGIGGSSADSRELREEAIKRGDLQFGKNTFASTIFNQFKTSCENSSSARLCKIFKEASDTGKQKIKATVEGFVSAYRATNTLAREKSRLNTYRQVLTDGISKEQLEKIDTSGLAGVNTEFLKELEEFKSDSDKDSKFKVIAKNINEYKVCIAKRSLGNTTEDCSLDKGTVDKLSERMAKLGNLQQQVLGTLGNNNAKLKLSMEAVFTHDQAHKKLSNVSKMFAHEKSEDDSLVLQKSLEDKMKGHQEELKKWTKSIFNQINRAQNDAQTMADLKTKAKVDESIKKFLNSSNPADRPKKKDIEQTNVDMAEMITKAFTKVCEKEKKEDITAEQCGEAKAQQVDVGALFKKDTDGELAIDPDKIGEFLNHVNTDDFKQAIADLENDLDNKIKKNQDELNKIRENGDNKTLAALLGYYGDKVQQYCPNDKEMKAAWKCVRDPSSTSGDAVYALINEAGDIVARLPESPERMQISALNEKCSKSFMDSFKGDDQELIKGYCQEVHVANEKHLEQFKPTERDKIYPYVHRYWDGEKWVVEKRTRKRWIVGRSVAEGALKFLPWELNRQMENTQIELWEQSTIDSIKARNNYLDNFYANGPFYPWPQIYPGAYGGYYGGIGPTFTPGFTGVGQGGFFPMATTTSTTVGSTSTGFTF